MSSKTAFSSGLDGDASADRGATLWEARPTLLETILPPVMVMLLTAPFWGAALAMLSHPHWATRSALRIAGVQIPLDAQGATEARYALIVIFLAFCLQLIVAAIRRAGQLHYRIDGQMVEVWRREPEHGMAIADIRYLTSKRTLFGRRVWVRRGPNGGIVMALRADDADRLLAVLEALGVEQRTLPAEPEIAALAPDEPIRWRGRLGLGSFDMGRAILAGALLAPPLLLAIALRWIWIGEPIVALALAESVTALALFGWAAGIALAAFGVQARIWFFDAFGAVLVTDRRIAWRAPLSGHLYRDVAFADLLDATIVEQKGRRAWVALTIRKGDDVRSEDMRGLPDADRFLAVLRPGAQ